MPTSKYHGLPIDIFWTSNGTIFGTPTTAGEWRLNIQYESLTEVGTYETILTVRQKIYPKVLRIPSIIKTTAFRSFFLKL
jgi:hypothetical protein